MSWVKRSIELHGALKSWAEVEFDPEEHNVGCLPRLGWGRLRTRRVWMAVYR